MNAIENQVRELVAVELAAANERFPQFHSRHEGYAVILEEVEETKREISALNAWLGNLWCVVVNNRDRQDANNELRKIRGAAINAACEAIQVAAMASKFLDMEAKNG